MSSITTTGSFRTENVTHQARKQLEPHSRPYLRGFEPVTEPAIERLIEKVKSEGRTDVYVSREVIMPKRGTKKSAGYDVASHSDMIIPVGKKATLWTNIKAHMQVGEVLFVDVRSSIGVKRDLMLANTIGVIDCDFYDNKDNEGNISICLRNMGEEDVVIKKGERVAQFIFIPFLVSGNCNTDAERIGGTGSTGR